MLDRIEADGPGIRRHGRTSARISSSTRCWRRWSHMDQRRKAIFVAFHDLIPGTTYVKPGESWPPELRRHSTAPWKKIRVIIEERRVSPRSDFISDLVNARDQGDKLTDRELFDQIFGICGASLSATSRAAGGALYLLYTHDGPVAEQLIANPALIPDALEECLRLGSNGYFTFPRIAARDTEVGGTRILKGMVVRPSPLAPNYDPDVFPDPTALRHSSQAEADSILRRGAASLHRQHSRPHHHHHRNPQTAGAVSAGASQRSEFHRRFMAARSANCGCKACR